MPVNLFGVLGPRTHIIIWEVVEHPPEACCPLEPWSSMDLEAGAELNELVVGGAIAGQQRRPPEGGFVPRDGGARWRYRDPT